MKRSLLLLTAALVVVTVISLPSFQASADRMNDPHDRQRWHNRNWETPSVWCKQNPQKCKEESSQKSLVSTDYEKCLDKMGDRDGYIDGWELVNFGAKCK